MSSRLERNKARRAAKEGVDKAHRREYARAGRRKDEDEENVSRETDLTFVLPYYEDCELCWARFENGAFTCGCKCVTVQVEDAS